MAGPAIKSLRALQVRRFSLIVQGQAVSGLREDLAFPDSAGPGCGQPAKRIDRRVGTPGLITDSLALPRCRRSLSGRTFE